MSRSDTAQHPKETSVIDAAPKQLLIGGKWRAATGDRTYEVEDPSTGQALCPVADASPEDGLEALAAADEAQKDWAQYPPRERGEILRRGYELIMQRHED